MNSMSRVWLWGVYLASATLWAQTTGTIVGRVTDPTLAAIPQARVELTNESTGITEVRTPGEEGDFVFQRLIPGNYRLAASAGGFKSVTKRGITLLVNQTARIDIQLEVGSVTSTLEVEATAPMVQSETSSVGNVVDSNQVRSMPLNGRTGINGLMAMAPGVQQAGSNPAIAGAAYRGGTGQTVDGVSNDDAIGERLLGQMLSLDGVAEFKVIANAAPAEFGKSAQVVIASKSGGNVIHGSLFEFNRNAVATAKTHSAQLLAKPPFNRNEYGGSVGGPVIKNKLFYFGSFEGLRLVQSSTTQMSMPRTAMKTGDFSNLLPGTVIKDPMAGGAPFTGNIIPSNRISSVSQQFLKYMPDPNLPGQGTAGLGTNFVANVPQHQPNDRYSARGDYQISDRDMVSVRYFWTNNGPYSTAGGGVPFGNWDGFGISTKNLAAQYTRVFSPTIANVFRVGLNYWEDYRMPQNHDLDPSKIIPGATPPLEGLGGLPTMSMTGFTTLSDQPGSGDVNHQRQFSDNLSWERGKHSLKFGVDFARVDVVNRQNSSPYRGSFAFDGRYSGNSFADYLLGTISTSSRATSNFVLDDVNYRFSAYAQDDWRVSNRLTINVGLRYDYQSPWEKNNDLAVWDRGRNALAVISGTADPIWSGVVPIVDANTLGLDRSNYMTLGSRNFAPRIGMAFRPLGTTKFVIRAAYGIYYNVMGEYDGAVDLRDLGLNPPFRASQTFLGSNNGVPNLTWTDPWAGTGSSSTSSPPNLYAVDKNFRIGYSQQWNYTMEWEPVRNTALRASYVGSKATHFVQAVNINDPLPSSLAVQPRRAYQPWGNIYYYQSDRNLALNQIQLGATRRTASGLSFGAEYQFTRALGGPYDGALPTTWTNLRLDRGNSSQYVKNYLVANYIYELPIGKGKPWLSNVAGLTNKLVSGWQVAGIATFASGNYLSVTFNSNKTGWPSGRADIVGDPGAAQKNQFQWFNPAAYAVPAAYTFGNSAPLSITGPGSVNWDTALFKMTSLTERINLELRGEAFNVLNHANLGNPGTNISVPASVGIITSRNGSRVVQFGARLTF